ncbi:MAG: YfaZ family outer membrane protein [Gammaproteobacteria bacterium]
MRKLFSAGLVSGILVTLTLLATPATAHELDLSVSNSAFRAGYANSLGNGLRLDGGWLRDSDEGNVVHAGLQVTGDAAPNHQKLTAGVGVRLAYLDGEGSKREGYALGIGGSLRWIVPGYDRFSVYGEYYWAPDLLSGGDAEKYVDTSIHLGYNVTRQAEVYVGARYTGADYDKRPSIKFDTGMHIGFNLHF